MRIFYEALKAAYGPSHQIQAPLRSSDGNTLLTDKDAFLQRWSKHFEGLFSDRRTAQESSLGKIPQVDVKLEMDDPPTHEEIKKATMQLKVGKLPGIDGIQAEDGIRDCPRSRGLGDVYKRQPMHSASVTEEALEML